LRDDVISAELRRDPEGDNVFFFIVFTVLGFLAVGMRCVPIGRTPMPYLRLHSPKVPIEQKRIIAQRLIEATMRAFHLRPNERYNVSVEFVSEPNSSAADLVGGSLGRHADCIFEVMGHDLTEAKKKAFAKEVAALITPLLPLKSRMRLARLLGVKPDESHQIAFQFGELTPAISEPFVAHPSSKAA
jgi:phenylpyruvate tautomerase PptA (4-oxalocrotonate tautomerase family)